jgi:hypothetical protein
MVASAGVAPVPGFEPGTFAYRRALGRAMRPNARAPPSPLVNADS